MKKPIPVLMTVLMVLFIATSALTLSVGAKDDALVSAPPNSAFVDVLRNPPEPFYGYIPPPMNLSHLKDIPVEDAKASSLPSSFDWRDSGKVTSVKDQDTCGTCWAFGTTSVLESAVLIGENAAYDFSEQSVALCVDRSWDYLYDDWDDPCMGGGWSWLASEVFIKKGSVLESCNPYDPSALCCDGSCVCDTCPAIKKVDGYRLATNDGSQITVIKNAVYNEGPVTVAYQHNSYYLYWDSTYGYIHDNYPCYGYANHLVSIIGWNDNVPHPNPSHGGTGAWIVKNSWGTGWGNSGFFYLAYDSSCVEEVAYLEYKDPVPSEELLYWDEAGHINSVGWGDNSAWMASVFTADEAGDLTHVDFWTTSNNAQYELYVWDGYFGTELAHQTGTCQEYGYYSVPLSTPIARAAGQQFTVGVKMTTPGFGYPISVEEEYPGVVDPPIQAGVSFIRHTSSDSWLDLADYDWNGCLRARMVSVIEKPDLVIEKKWEEWVKEGYYTVTYVIHNKGTAVAKAGHSTTLYVDKNEIEHKKVPVDLKPCETYTDTFETIVKCTAPSDIIMVCADNYDEVDELNEENNCIRNELECPTCEPSIDVEKTVRDPETGKWVDEVTVPVSTIVRFRGVIHNDGTCCNLTEIVVDDVLSDSLEYKDNATVDGKPWEPVLISPNTYRWKFPNKVLQPCQTITIEFDAHAAKPGEDVNVMYARGVCEGTGEEVEDKDAATVNVISPAKNNVYFVPQHSVAHGYCKTTEVEIWVNATNLKSGQINMNYDPGCANVTGYVGNATNFPMSGWSHHYGSEWITFMTLKPSITGNYQIGTLTIHCVNDSSDGCKTPLEFDMTDPEEYCALFDPDANEIPANWIEGTFECKPGICGDVNCDGKVNMGDVGLLHNHVQYGNPICDEWAADVNCDGKINMGDVGLLHNHVQYGRPLNCC